MDEISDMRHRSSSGALISFRRLCLQIDAFETKFMQARTDALTDATSAIFGGDVELIARYRTVAKGEADAFLVLVYYILQLSMRNGR